jgi:hypothetical protein
MPKKKKTESEPSYEVLGTPYDQREDTIASIHQVVEDIISENPSCGFKAKFQGENEMMLVYHAYEMDLPTRMKEVESQCEDLFSSFVKRMKKDFKSHTGHALKIKEDKKRRSATTEKVSLNSRYYYRACRYFEVTL